MNNKTILIFDNSTNSISDLITNLTQSGFNILIASSYEESKELINLKTFDMLIISLNFKNEDEINFFNFIQSSPTFTIIPTILILEKNEGIENLITYEYYSIDIFYKPLNIQPIMKFIKEYFKRISNLAKRYETKMEDLRNSITSALPHEFRTSINGILGCAECNFRIIKKIECQSDLNLKCINEMSNAITESGKKLYRLTENFLLYSQIQTIINSNDKIFELRSENIHNPKEIIVEIYEMLPDEMKSSFIFDIELQNAPIQISYYYFFKLCYELIDNAIKFSENNSKIIIKSEIQYNYYVITITDYGLGMTQEQINNIGAYKQFNRNINEQQGTGLGLIIAKLITKIHRGIFKIESKINNGTTIEVHIPLYQNKHCIKEKNSSIEFQSSLDFNLIYS